jgi:tight adherence protein C
MSVLIGLMFSLSVTMLIGGIRRIRVAGFEEQLAPFGGMPEATARTRYERWVRPVALRLAEHVSLLRGLTDPVKTAQRLDYAGNPGNLTTDELYGVQLCGTLAGLLLGTLLLASGLPFSQFGILLLPLTGFLLPQLWLRRKVRQRQHAISVALPDLLDMLAVCVSAGMGFDVALALLAERGEGPLYEELDRLLRELRMGEPREAAFRRMAQRNSSEHLRAFIDALLQAEELGTPVALTLERQAEDMRVSRRHQARAAGAKAATKISLVVVLLVMPSVLCLILSALVMTIGRSIGPLGPGGS